MPSCIIISHLSVHLKIIFIGNCTKNDFSIVSTFNVFLVILDLLNWSQFDGNWQLPLNDFLIMNQFYWKMSTNLSSLTEYLLKTMVILFHCNMKSKESIKKIIRLLVFMILNNSIEVKFMKYKKCHYKIQFYMECYEIIK